MRPPLIYFFAGIVWGFLLAYLFIGILDKGFSRTNDFIYTNALTYQSPPSERTYPNQYELEILTNEYRTGKGRLALKHDTKLCSVAEERYTEVKEDWSHDQMILKREKGLMKNTFPYFGENLSKELYSATDTLEALKNSKSHNDNLLSTSYQYTCVRCYESYCVQLFGGSENVLFASSSGNLPSGSKNPRPHLVHSTFSPMRTK